MDWFRISLVLIYVSCIAATGFAQNYFRVSEANDVLDQKIAKFSNGDLLIGNSSTESLRTGDETGILILQRIDNCGLTLWMHKYQYDGGYLILKDIAINQRDEIFMFGSHYKGLIESIFISKVEIQSLDVAEFRIFNPGSVDHFTYSLDLSENSLLIYGLLLDFNSSKEGFVGLFDHNLNFMSASKFVPFESTGDARLLANGIIARSGPYIYKFNQKMELEWAFNTTDQQDLQNIGGPYLLADGYIFESHKNGLSFLYKLDRSGNLEWTSDQIDKTNIAGDLSLMPNGNLLFSYNRIIGSETELSFLMLDQSSIVVGEKLLTHNYSINTGVIKQLVDGDLVKIVGSKNEFGSNNYDIENFILQLKLDGVSVECYEVQQTMNTRPNTVSISFDAIPVEPEAFDLELINRLRLKSSLSTDASINLCQADMDIAPTVESIVLPCEEVWNIQLPNTDFSWDDGFDSINRALSKPGVYAARSMNCDSREFLEYRLVKEECACNIFVPTVFTPNGDTTNDILEFGFSCTLESINFSIFDRWGGLVFNSNSTDHMWQGKINQQDAPVGVYSIYLNYKWLDSGGLQQEKKIAQTVTLVR